MIEEFNWNDFVELYDWEFDILCVEQKEDVKFYMELAEEQGDKILEIGCGTGRITLPLLEAGYMVTAVDSASNFLEKIKKKTRENHKVRLINSDMRDLNLNEKFSLIIFSYSTFQYLLTKQEQESVLNNIRQMLSSSGKLVFDISPFTASGTDQLEYYPFYTHRNEKINAMVTMFTSYRIDTKNRVQYWTDRYEIRYDVGGSKTFIHSLALRRIEILEFTDMLQRFGFKIDKILGGFNNEEVTEDSSNWVFLIGLQE